MTKQSFQDKSVPKLELGNEEQADLLFSLGELTVFRRAGFRIEIKHDEHRSQPRPQDRVHQTA
jgi:hypothetical protein